MSPCWKWEDLTPWLCFQSACLHWPKTNIVDPILWHKGQTSGRQSSCIEHIFPRECGRFLFSVRKQSSETSHLHAGCISPLQESIDAKDDILEQWLKTNVSSWMKRPSFLAKEWAREKDSGNFYLHKGQKPSEQFWSLGMSNAYWRKVGAWQQHTHLRDYFNWPADTGL